MKAKANKKKSKGKSVPLVEGKKYRFVVNSPEEAVQTVQERMGERGRVLSVKQMNGKGLSKFLKAPKLEIIAVIPEAEEEERKPLLEVKDGPPVVPEIDPEEVPAKQTENPVEMGSVVEEGKPADVPRTRPHSPIRPEGLAEKLRRAGFGESLMMRLESSPKWKDLQEATIAHGLAGVASWLRDDFRGIEKRELANRVAFIGTPGSGKTTSLCKRISNEVLLHNKTVQVLKLEGEEPNSLDELSIFCDVIGVPLLRDPLEMQFLPESDRLYIDLSGVSWSNADELEQTKKQLDQLKVGSRVLVMNGAYESELIKASFEMGTKLGATHCIFTHLDEVIHATKLWQFITCGGLTPLSICTGQNITSDYTDDVFEYLMAATFPTHLVY